jgi:quercetin dioxygenase-like cupin family protein
VTVRDQDRCAGCLQLVQLALEQRRLSTRVDDDSLQGAAAGPHDVAIRPDRAEFMAVDKEAHGRLSLTAGLQLLSSRIASMQSWNLREISTPGGSRSPVVLRSDDAARAVLISLEPGQALGEHQVKEGALVSVVEGTVRVESGGRTIEGQVGCFFSFDADERRSISTDTGARILMVLSPWPGEGHYRGDQKS